MQGSAVVVIVAVSCFCETAGNAADDTSCFEGQFAEIEHDGDEDVFL